LTFATALGTILHFLYEWTGVLFFTPISAVNESTWEHMKILFFPMIIFACVQCYYFKEYPSFWWVKLIGIFVGVGSIPILFYTYNGAFSTSPDWLNILFFFLAAGFGYLIEGILFKKEASIPLPIIAIILLVGIAILFIVFTYSPPHVPLFHDPLTNSYGLQTFPIPY
jgi:hypothetical protein